MYKTKYTDNPGSNEELLPCSCTHDDNFATDYETCLNNLDRFMFLVDMYRIVRSCTADLLALKSGQDTDFWYINKILINYLNAVFSYKEYVNSYEPPLKEITDDYYYNQKWYRFVCDYRNRVIHQSTIIRDRSVKTGDIFIDIDDMIRTQNDVLAALIADPNSKESSIKNAKRFLSELESLLPVQTTKPKGDKHFRSMKEIARKADQEILAMNDKVLWYAYRNGVLPTLRWLLSKAHKEGGQYRYTFIVNEEWINIPEKEDIACFEPNYSLESFYSYLLQALGKENSICTAIRNILKADGYTYVYELNCSLEEFYTREGI